MGTLNIRLVFNITIIERFFMTMTFLSSIIISLLAQSSYGALKLVETKDVKVNPGRTAPTAPLVEAPLPPMPVEKTIIRKIQTKHQDYESDPFAPKTQRFISNFSCSTSCDGWPYENCWTTQDTTMFRGEEIEELGELVEIKTRTFPCLPPLSKGGFVFETVEHKAFGFTVKLQIPKWSTDKVSKVSNYPKCVEIKDIQCPPCDDICARRDCKTDKNGY